MLGRKRNKEVYCISNHFLALTAFFWGSQAEEALQKYLQSKEFECVTIWQTDLILTAREEEMEGEKKMEKKDARQKFYTF